MSSYKGYKGNKEQNRRVKVVFFQAGKEKSPQRSKIYYNILLSVFIKILTDLVLTRKCQGGLQCRKHFLK